MAVLTIRNLDEALKGRLRIRAALEGRSMEEEARQILKAALDQTSSDKGSFVDRIRERFAPLGGVDLNQPAREAVREPAATYEVTPAKKKRPAKKQPAVKRK